MDGSSSSKQSRLLGRLLGKLRGEHRYSTIDKSVSYSSTGRETSGGVVFVDTDLHRFRISDSVGCGSSFDEEVDASPDPRLSSVQMDHAQFAANIDMRYSGQYLTPEQLPEFCNQLQHLVDVIRNIQSYAKVTGEYPKELERRLEREACEVAALACEARNAHEVAERVHLQRRALKAQRVQLTAHVAKLRETAAAFFRRSSLQSTRHAHGYTNTSSYIYSESMAVLQAIENRSTTHPVRELENSVRLSDRRLFKNWEMLKDSTDPAAYDTFLEDVRNKQTALECLVRLVEGRRGQVSRASPPRPLPPPDNDDDDTQVTFSSRKRHDNRRTTSKRKRTSREARSVPLSNEPSRHETQQPQQITLYITGGSAVADAPPRPRATRVLPSLELPRGSVRDILFFTAN